MKRGAAGIAVWRLGGEDPTIWNVVKNINSLQNSLAKQRYRWSYGTLLCLWKHRDALFNPIYKGLRTVALPNMWIFQYLFLTLSPVAYIYFFFGIFSKSAHKLLIFYLIFLATDLITAAFSFSLEKESKRPLCSTVTGVIIFFVFPSSVK